MPTSISGTIVATLDDLREISRAINSLNSHLSEVETDFSVKFDQQSSRITTIQSELKTHTTRLTKVESGLKDLESTFDSVLAEVEQSAAHLGEIQKKLVENVKVLDLVAESSLERAEGEKNRRKELSDSLLAIKAHQQHQIELLLKAFDDLQNRTRSLIEAEQENTQKLSAALERIQDSIEYTQSQSQAQLDELAAVITGFQQAKQERASQEQQRFENLLEQQSNAHRLLEKIHQVADQINQHSAESEALQVRWQTRQNKTLAQRLNFEALQACERGATTASIVLLERAVELDNDEPAYQVNLAKAHRLAGSDSAAEQILKTVLANVKRYIGGWIELGRLQISQKQYEAAEKSLRTAIEIDPDACTAWLLLGEILFRNGKISEGIAAWKTAQTIDPAETSTNLLASTWLAEQRAIEVEV
ncbi:MAG TPA: tetratricopeptide repeat protein [Anaerolineaceae bacterium]